jgi:predicted short-subunit dehydrogenase-like oxidoreductase (DUF2520 family)
MGMQSISIIGLGRLGGALAVALSRAGFPLENLVHRDASTANSLSTLLPSTTKLVPRTSLATSLRSDVILIATPDPQIAAVADELKGRLKPGAVVLHTSGSLSSEVLSALAGEGYSTGSIHPLISVSDAVSGADNFANAFFCVEGDEVAGKTARSIVEALGGRPFSIAPERKALYHAAAVVASGHLVALVDLAIEMLSKSGVQNDRAQEILLPLVSTTVGNLAASSPQRALTGSFARGDLEAVKRHLASIDSSGMPSSTRDVYLLLGERSLDLAAANGADVGKVQALREVISIAKRKAG